MAPLNFIYQMFLHIYKLKQQSISPKEHLLYHLIKYFQCSFARKTPLFSFWLGPHAKKKKAILILWINITTNNKHFGKAAVVCGNENETGLIQLATSIRQWCRSDYTIMKIFH